jgi:hypothetical protein
VDCTSLSVTCPAGYTCGSVGGGTYACRANRSTCP